MSTRQYIAYIPIRDLLLVIMLLYLCIKYRHVNSYTGAGKLIVITGVVLLAFIIRSWYGGNLFSALVRADLRVLLWFYGGISVGYIFGKVHNKDLTLLVLTIILLIFITLASIFSESYAIYSSGGYVRVSHQSLFLISAVFIPMFVLLFSIGKNTIARNILYLTIWLVFTILSAVLSSTRSMLLVSIIILFTLIISFQSNLSNNKVLITNNIHYKVFFYIVLIVLSAPIIIPNIDIMGRLEGGLKVNSLLVDGRAYEALDFFRQMSMFELIFGKGLGGHIFSYIRNYEATHSLHIGLLSLWMKYGIFLVVVVLVIIMSTIKLYFKSFNAKIYIPSSDYSNRIIVPMILPSYLSLFISGGVSEGNFLMYGFIYFLYGFYNKSS